MSVKRTIVKGLAAILVAFLLFHWFVGGQSEIVKGPPTCPPQSQICTNN